MTERKVQYRKCAACKVHYYVVCERHRKESDTPLWRYTKAVPEEELVVMVLRYPLVRFHSSHCGCREYIQGGEG